MTAFRSRLGSTPALAFAIVFCGLVVGAAAVHHGAIFALWLIGSGALCVWAERRQPLLRRP